jgi:hypothetical protein
MNPRSRHPYTVILRVRGLRCVLQVHGVFLNQVMDATVHLCAELMALVLQIITFRLDLLYALPDRVNSAVDHGGGA